MKRSFLAVICGLAFASLLPAAKTLDMWVVDTEGGQAVLVVSPSGKSMLVDTGFAGFNERDTTRILEACAAAGVKKIDTLVTTHYDFDHVGNLPSLVSRIPVDLFVDHGPAVVNDRMTAMAVKAYDELWAKARHMVVKPGDKIPFEGVDVQVVASARQFLTKPLAGAGKPNPSCRGLVRMTWTAIDEDASENAAAVGMLFTFGAFRMLNLADLTWNRELELMCPNDPIGTVDLFMVSHHGNNISNSPALVNAIQARVHVMSNGPRKVGAASVFKILKSAPRSQAVYATHWSANARDENPAPEFLANLQDSPDGKFIKISAAEDGTIAVTNGRTGETKTFKR